MNELQDLLNRFFESNINRFKFDLFTNQIILSFKSIENTQHQIVFKDVSCFYFINDNTENRLEMSQIDIEEGDYLELTAIYLLDSLIEVNLLSKETWVNYYKGYGNIAIEIWSQVLVIESYSVTIDGIEYKVENF